MSARRTWLCYGVVCSRAWLIAVAIGIALVALLGGSALYARDQIASRDAALADLRAAEARLSGDVSRLGIERDDLVRTRESLRRERDDAAAQRDLLATARDSLAARVMDLERREADQQRRIAALDARATELERSLADRERQLAAARATPTGGSPTPTPSPSPVGTPASADVRRLVELDDQIRAEFDVLLGHIDAVSQAFVRGNLFEVNAAYQRGLQSADRLKDLFNRRAPVIDRLR